MECNIILNHLYSEINDESLQTLSNFLFSFSMNIKLYKAPFKLSNISPNIYPALMLGQMLGRLSTMLGHQILTFLMLGEICSGS